MAGRNTSRVASWRTLASCASAFLLLQSVLAAPPPSFVANRTNGRWQLMLPADAVQVEVDGRATPVSTPGRLDLDKLAQGLHTLKIGTTSPSTLILRESGTRANDAVQTPTRVFEAVVEDPKLRRPAPTFRVTQGEVVQLNVSSAATVEVHLHGYDVAARAAQGTRLSIVFDANLAGRFSFETHGQAHGAVAFLEVLPR